MGSCASSDQPAPRSGEQPTRQVVQHETAYKSWGSGTKGFEDGPPSRARFNGPLGLAVTPSGNILVGDSSNHRIRLIDAEGNVSTFAGAGLLFGDAIDGPARRAGFFGPSGLAVAEDGTVFVADTLHGVIRMIDPRGTVSTLTGTRRCLGFRDGDLSAALFYWPEGLALTKGGHLIVADTRNHRIRRVSRQGVTTLAGSGQAGNKDGTAREAAFNCPRAVAIGPNGHLMATDGNKRLCSISMQGQVSTISAAFQDPQGLLVDCRGNALVADSGSHQIIFCTPHGVLTVVADGTHGEVLFRHPRGMALDHQGRVLVSEQSRVVALSLPSTRRVQQELSKMSDLVSRSARSLFAWTVKFTLNGGGPFGKGPFQLSVEIPFDYPSGAPLVKLLSHPNTGLPQVDATTGEVKCMVWDEAKSNIVQALHAVKGLLVHSTPLPADAVLLHVREVGEERKNDNTPRVPSLPALPAPVQGRDLSGKSKPGGITEAARIPSSELPSSVSAGRPVRAVLPAANNPAAAEEPQGPGADVPVAQQVPNERKAASSLRDGGSVEFFWRQRLEGVLDPDDVAETASKLAMAGFKQRHLGKLSRAMLAQAGLNQGNILDILEHQKTSRPPSGRRKR